MAGRRIYAFVAYNIFFYIYSSEFSAIVWCQPPSASCMAGRDYLPFGVPRRTPGERGAREGSQAVPRRPPPMEGFPPYQQAAQSVPDGNRSYFNPEYNQFYDNHDRYVNNSDYYNNGDPYNYEDRPVDAEDTVMDFNNFHENSNGEPANYDYGLPPLLTARMNNVYSNTNSNQNSGNNVRNYYDATNNYIDNNQPS